MSTVLFDVWPKVVRADRKTKVSIKPLFKHCEFTNPEQIRVQYLPEDGKFLDGSTAEWGGYQLIEHMIADGVVSIEVVFAREAEHTLRLVRITDTDDEVAELGVFQVYSLEEDLMSLRPFKGDFHIHSHCSDGKESPAYVAASARRIGLNFMALTDHGQYKPSLEAIASIAELETDLKCYPGEEVHPPDNSVHTINFGGSFSVNELFQRDENTYRKEVDERSSHISEVSGSSLYQVASSEWVFDKIRDGGGISMYCHPYWKPHNRYDVNSEVSDAIVTRQKFDVLEVIGGFHRNQMESNALAVAMYHENQSQGQKIPVAGVSDAHGCDGDLFGWYYTVVFAKTDAFQDLADGIRSLNSVAVEAVPGEFPRVIGPLRLVKFVYYLLREFYPIHDRLCEDEGRLMFSHLAGNDFASERLAALKGQVPELLTHYWDD